MPDFGIFRGFNDNLFGDKLFAGQLPINLGNNFDPDAAAFFQRVSDAGGTLSATEQQAILTLVADLKNSGIWTAMKAIYPMVGGGTGTTAQRQAACSQNLKSSSFTGSFSTNWTFRSTGVTPSSTFMNTGLNVSANLSQNSTHLSYYSRTNVSGPQVEMGVTGVNSTYILFSYLGIAYSAINESTQAQRATAASPTTGFLIGSRTSSTEERYFTNNVAQTRTAASTGLANLNVFLGAYNSGGSAAERSTKECAFASIGDGLTDTECNNFYTAVQAFQTTLSRQV
jgi:hypothetical protein